MFLLTSSLFKAFSYFSEWHHHHPGSQTSNLEFILDTILSPTPSLFLPLLLSVHYQVLSFYLADISQICPLVFTSHHLSILSCRQHLWPTLLELPPNWSSYSYSGPPVCDSFSICRQRSCFWSADLVKATYSFLPLVKTLQWLFVALTMKTKIFCDLWGHIY